VASTKAFKSTWCCEQGRLFLVFSLLCGPESPTLSILQHQKSKPRAKSESSVATAQETRRQKLRQSQLSEGIGYGDRVQKREKKTLLPKSGGSDNSYDLELYFQGLASVWPPAPSKSAGGFGCLPRSVVPEMLARSPMLQHASELLRHAAIQEINFRRGPITALLDFLETVGHHAEACQLLLRPRTLFPPTEQLGHAILGNTKIHRMTGSADHETAQSIATVVETLAISHRKFLETARKSGNFGARDDKALFEAAQRICAIADGVGSLRGQLAARESQEMSCNPLAALFRSSTANVATRRMRAAATRKTEATAVQDRTTRISEWHRVNCVKEVPDDTILKQFHYAQAAANAAKNPKQGVGRMKKLLAQISSLSTDLPEGIFVRHGESRIDVLKVMIVGPADTPYEHGLFEFDMFCDNDFPKKPPQMFFRTTGNGLVSFNPNLYQNGKGEYFPCCPVFLDSDTNICASLSLVAGNVAWRTLAGR
jgi:baculoviral IAP repeat-containing protein 6